MRKVFVFVMTCGLLAGAWEVSHRAVPVSVDGGDPIPTCSPKTCPNG